MKHFLNGKILLHKQRMLSHTRFCKSIIKRAKENYYIAGNDLVRFIEYFKIGVIIIKY